MKNKKIKLNNKQIISLSVLLMLVLSLSGFLLLGEDNSLTGYQTKSSFILTPNSFDVQLMKNGRIVIDFSKGIVAVAYGKKFAVQDNKHTRINEKIVDSVDYDTRIMNTAFNTIAVSNALKTSKLLKSVAYEDCSSIKNVNKRYDYQSFNRVQSGNDAEIKNTGYSIRSDFEQTGICVQTKEGELLKLGLTVVDGKKRLSWEYLKPAVAQTPSPIRAPSGPSSPIIPDCSLQANSIIRGTPCNWNSARPVKKATSVLCLNYCISKNADSCEWSEANKDCYAETGSGCFVQGGFRGWHALKLPCKSVQTIPTSTPGFKPMRVSIPLIIERAQIFPLTGRLIDGLVTAYKKTVTVKLSYDNKILKYTDLTLRTGADIRAKETSPGKLEITYTTDKDISLGELFKVNFEKINPKATSVILDTAFEDGISPIKIKRSTSVVKET